MPNDRPLRADARRNAQAVIDAARQLFAQQGVQVPMEQIGRAAGVGKGTLYRHFPTRDHLLAAVSRDRFTRLTTEVGLLLKDHQEDAAAAFTAWLRDYDRSAQLYRGLRTAISAGIADDGSAIFASCAPMKERAGTLLARAQQAGAIRADVDLTAILSLVAALPDHYRDTDGASQLLDIVLRGIAAAPSPSLV